LLKKEYELENNFRYDVVLQLRPNLCFLEPLELETPIPNTIYTYDSCQDDKYGVYKVSDKFFYGDSHTVDQVSEFFKFLSFIDVTWVTWKKTTIQFTPTEIAFYYYMTNIGILNHPTKVKIA